MSQIKKLSVATVYGKIDLKKLLAAPGERIELMTVIGSAVGMKDGTSSYGDWRALLGIFQATNLETGEVFDASTLFLPEVAMIPITVSLAQPGTRGVEFAIKISARYAHDAKPGGSAYEYTWEPLLPPDQSDPVTRIKAKLDALRLEAPKGDETPKPDEGKGGKGRVK